MGLILPKYMPMRHAGVCGCSKCSLCCGAAACVSDCRRAGCVPVGDHAGVVVEPLGSEAAPVVQDHVQVKVPGRHLCLPVLQLLESPLAQHEGGRTCIGAAVSIWIFNEQNAVQTLQCTARGCSCGGLSYSPLELSAAVASCTVLPVVGKAVSLSQLFLSKGNEWQSWQTHQGAPQAPSAIRNTCSRRPKHRHRRALRPGSILCPPPESATASHQDIPTPLLYYLCR